MPGLRGYVVDPYRGPGVLVAEVVRDLEGEIVEVGICALGWWVGV